MPSNLEIREESVRDTRVLLGVCALEFGDPVTEAAPAPPRNFDSSSSNPLFLRNATWRSLCLAILSCKVVYNSWPQIMMKLSDVTQDAIEKRIHMFSPMRQTPHLIKYQTEFPRRRKNRYQRKRQHPIQCYPPPFRSPSRYS